MILENITDKRDRDKVKIKCDGCEKVYFINKVSAKKKDKHYCRSCHVKLFPRIQNSREFCIQMNKKAINSNYYNSIKTRNTNGANNSMFGKKHTIITKQKMSIARTGKTGEKSTAWKGGKNSINKSIRKILHTRFNWYQRIYIRDKYKCVECGNNNKIDAHHIIPLSHIIKRLLKNKPENIKTQNEILEWLLSHEEIIDTDLFNGITLCRSCHKLKHKNWGSHNIQ